MTTMKCRYKLFTRRIFSNGNIDENDHFQTHFIQTSYKLFESNGIKGFQRVLLIERE